MLDYAENRPSYRQALRGAIMAGEAPVLGEPRNALRDCLRVVERTYFQFVAELLPEDYKRKFSALSNSDKSFRGFCRHVVPDPAERARLFAWLREGVRRE